jgi:ArsR family transcriptional regulator, arsenate/arsenite/antimonite-responsive transcriptional repressor
MEASEIYKCIADPQRLRVLNLLDNGPLCVCHLQELLAVPQVKMSKQLALMKQLGLIEASREGTWMIYALKAPGDGLLQANLAYLRTAACNECNQLQCDLTARTALLQRITQSSSEECPQGVYRPQSSPVSLAPRSTSTDSNPK